MLNQLDTILKRRHRDLCITIIILFGSMGCIEENKNEAPPQLKTPSDCRGIYYERDKNGNLKKFNQWWNESAKACYTEGLALSRWEDTSEKWDKNEVKCDPQPQFHSRSLISANNYYQYRNGKDYLDLDSSTGIFRRLTIGEDTDGTPVFTRWQGCFYQRTGQGVDVVYGDQLLLDGDSSKIKTSEHFNPMEIFTYTESPTSFEMARFDSSGDWDWKFCPDRNTPWGYCDFLRNGNIWFYPVLSASEQASLLAEALLIRRQFNFNTISKSYFENIWTNIEKTSMEIGHFKKGTNHIWKFKYKVNHLPDTPLFVDQAWRDYVKGLRPRMPDLSSIQIPPICYEGKREVILNDGRTALIYGEVCYINGEYIFTEN